MTLNYSNTRSTNEEILKEELKAKAQTLRVHDKDLQSNLPIVSNYILQSRRCKKRYCSEPKIKVQLFCFHPGDKEDNNRNSQLNIQRSPRGNVSSTSMVGYAKSNVSEYNPIFQARNRKAPRAAKIYSIHSSSTLFSPEGSNEFRKRSTFPNLGSKTFKKHYHNTTRTMATENCSNCKLLLEYEDSSFSSGRSANRSSLKPSKSVLEFCKEARIFDGLATAEPEYLDNEYLADNQNILLDTIQYDLRKPKVNETDNDVRMASRKNECLELANRKIQPPNFSSLNENTYKTFPSMDSIIISSQENICVPLKFIRHNQIYIQAVQDQCTTKNPRKEKSQLKCESCGRLQAQPIPTAKYILNNLKNQAVNGAKTKYQTIKRECSKRATKKLLEVLQHNPELYSSDCPFCICSEAEKEDGFNESNTSNERTGGSLCCCSSISDDSQFASSGFNRRMPTSQSNSNAEIYMNYSKDNINEKTDLDKSMSGHIVVYSYSDIASSPNECSARTQKTKLNRRTHVKSVVTCMCKHHPSRQRDANLCSEQNSKKVGRSRSNSSRKKKKETHVKRSGSNVSYASNKSRKKSRGKTKKERCKCVENKKIMMEMTVDNLVAEIKQAQQQVSEAKKRLKERKKLEKQKKKETKKAAHIQAKNSNTSLNSISSSQSNSSKSSMGRTDNLMCECNAQGICISHEELKRISKCAKSKAKSHKRGSNTSFTTKSKSSKSSKGSKKSGKQKLSKLCTCSHCQKINLKVASHSKTSNKSKSSNSSKSRKINKKCKCMDECKCKCINLKEQKRNRKSSKSKEKNYKDGSNTSLNSTTSITSDSSSSSKGRKSKVKSTRNAKSKVKNDMCSTDTTNSESSKSSKGRKNKIKCKCNGDGNSGNLKEKKKTRRGRGAQSKAKKYKHGSHTSLDSKSSKSSKGSKKSAEQKFGKLCTCSHCQQIDLKEAKNRENKANGSTSGGDLHEYKYYYTTIDQEQFKKSKGEIDNKKYDYCENPIFDSCSTNNSNGTQLDMTYSILDNYEQSFELPVGHNNRNFTSALKLPRNALKQYDIVFMDTINRAGEDNSNKMCTHICSTSDTSGNIQSKITKNNLSEKSCSTRNDFPRRAYQVRDVVDLNCSYAINVQLPDKPRKEFNASQVQAKYTNFEEECEDICMDTRFNSMQIGSESSRSFKSTSTSNNHIRFVTSKVNSYEQTFSIWNLTDSPKLCKDIQSSSVCNCDLLETTHNTECNKWLCNECLRIKENILNESKKDKAVYEKHVRISCHNDIPKMNGLENKQGQIRSCESYISENHQEHSKIQTDFESTNSIQSCNSNFSKRHVINPYDRENKRSGIYQSDTKRTNKRLRNEDNRMKTSLETYDLININGSSSNTRATDDKTCGTGTITSSASEYSTFISSESRERESSLNTFSMCQCTSVIKKTYKSDVDQCDCYSTESVYCKSIQTILFPTNYSGTEKKSNSSNLTKVIVVPLNNNIDIIDITKTQHDATESSRKLPSSDSNIIGECRGITEVSCDETTFIETTPINTAIQEESKQYDKCSNCKNLDNIISNLMLSTKVSKNKNNHEEADLANSKDSNELNFECKEPCVSSNSMYCKYNSKEMIIITDYDNDEQVSIIMDKLLGQHNSVKASDVYKIGSCDNCSPGDRTHDTNIHEDMCKMYRHVAKSDDTGYFEDGRSSMSTLENNEIFIEPSSVSDLNKYKSLAQLSCRPLDGAETVEYLLERVLNAEGKEDGVHIPDILSNQISARTSLSLERNEQKSFPNDTEQKDSVKQIMKNKCKDFFKGLYRKSSKKINTDGEPNLDARSSKRSQLDPFREWVDFSGIQDNNFDKY